MRIFKTASVAIALLVSTAQLQAQDAAPWRLSYFPYFTVSPNDGMMGLARMIWAQQAGWGERVVNARSVAVEAGYSTRDAWLARATFSDPWLSKNWRLKVRAEVGHEPRYGDPDFPIGHDRQVAWVDVTRRLKGPLQLAVKGAWRNDELDYTTANDVESVEQSDLSYRAALVLDLRDREYEINSGVVAEAGFAGGTGGSDGYGTAYFNARGYFHPILPLRLAGRVGWRQPIKSDALAPRLEFPAWEDPFPILGGHRTHRGLGTGQLSGDGAAFAGAEVRFDVLNVGELGAVTLLAFVDGAKVLNRDDPESLALLTNSDWVVGAGGGLALRFMRQATLTITAAGGEGETRWYVGSGFSW